MWWAANLRGRVFDFDNDGGEQVSYKPEYLGHVNIFVRNAERSQKWYADVLGLHTYGLRPDQVAFMAAELYQRLKDKGVPIKQVSDHGISIGIYFEDPDGNGLEVSYELPRDQWPRKEQLFAADLVDLGHFPGPWDTDAAAH